jgi:hypothetical protein
LTNCNPFLISSKAETRLVITSYCTQHSKCVVVANRTNKDNWLTPEDHLCSENCLAKWIDQVDHLEN